MVGDFDSYYHSDELVAGRLIRSVWGVSKSTRWTTSQGGITTVEICLSLFSFAI